MPGVPSLLVAASAAIVAVFGCLHLFHTFRGRMLYPRDEELVERMKRTAPRITRETTMWRAWVGFNATHSMSLILFGLFYGWLALVEPGVLFGSWFLRLLGTATLVSLIVLARRYFFSVDEAAALVLAALDHIGEVHGRVLSRAMKAAQIQDILDVWVAEKGGRWEKIPGRPGDRLDEDLIGDTELAYTRALELAGVAHYLVSFNTKVADPIPHMLSSHNAPRLSRDEIAALIVPPKEA